MQKKAALACDPMPVTQITQSPNNGARVIFRHSFSGTESNPSEKPIARP
jgi:hypothetical protein